MMRTGSFTQKLNRVRKAYDRARGIAVSEEAIRNELAKDLGLTAERLNLILSYTDHLNPEAMESLAKMDPPEDFLEAFQGIKIIMVRFMLGAGYSMTEIRSKVAEVIVDIFRQHYENGRIDRKPFYGLIEKMARNFEEPVWATGVSIFGKPVPFQTPKRLERKGRKAIARELEQTIEMAFVPEVHKEREGGWNEWAN